MKLKLNPQPTYQDAPGYTNLIDVDTGTRYLLTPYGWQVYFWPGRAFVNFSGTNLINQLNSSFDDLVVDNS